MRRRDRREGEEAWSRSTTIRTTRDDDVDAIVDACRRTLAPHGIAVTPAREGDELAI